MIQTISQILETSTQDKILELSMLRLNDLNESKMWKDKTPHLVEAILSVLVPLRDQKLLFSADGKVLDRLTPELILDYCDLMSLKTLAFTLEISNKEKSLKRTKHTKDEADKYKTIDLSQLGKYLSSYSVNLEDEWLDFPIFNYNLHIGIRDIVKQIFKA